MADTPVSPTNVSALPTAPNRNTQTDPLTYSQTADAWAGALPNWTTQVNNIAANVNFNADSAFDSAAEALVAKNAAEVAEAAALAAQAAAEAASNATEWVSGQAYDEGDVVWSPINILSYRANTNTSGTTDPSLSASWVLISANVSTSATQTLTNKTIESGSFTNGYTEEVFAIPSSTTPALSPTNGSIQTWTLTGASTPTAGTWASGQSMTLMIDDGTDYTIDWSSVAVTWKTDSGSAPTLNTTGFTAIALWKVSTTIYGARVGNN